MLKLKQRLYDAGYNMSDLAAEMNFIYPIVHSALCQGKIPIRKRAQFIDEVNHFLMKKDIEIEGVWSELADPDQTSLQTNVTDQDFYLETPMLTHDTLKHFKLFRNPFMNEIREAKDVYLSEDARYLVAAMRDVARHQGLLAVVGDSGAGKSILRKQLLEELALDGDVAVIQPKIIDKTAATAPGLCDAIIEDISDEKPRRSMEAKARQVENLLLIAAQGGQRHVLIIEEAHDLSVPVLKYLKRFWELEDGFSKLLGIILIGQTELGVKLNERKNYQLREFIRRCMVQPMPPLGRDLVAYLEHKFKRAGGECERILHKDCFDAIRMRLTTNTQGYDMTYPQIVNNLVARAMNYAQELGVEQVTSDIIKEC